MKAKYLCFVIMLAHSLEGSAQKHFPQFKIGIEGGPGLAHLRGNDYLAANYKSTFGYAAGLSFQILVPKSNASFKSNILFERKGAISDDLFFADTAGNIITSHNTISLTYIIIPAMLRIRSKGRIGLFINAGAYVGFLLKEEDIIGATGVLPETKVDNTFGDNKKDGGFCAGAGLEIPIREKFTLSFELRDNIGVYDINNTPRTKGGPVQTNSLNFSEF